jgi:hypothetical protein
MVSEEQGLQQRVYIEPDARAGSGHELMLHNLFKQITSKRGLNYLKERVKASPRDGP